MRRQHAFDAAGKNERDALLGRLRRLTRRAADRQRERLGQEAARVIVDEAVAVRLADDGDDLERIDRLRGDRLAQMRDIAGNRKGKSVDVRTHASSPLAETGASRRLRRAGAQCADRRLDSTGLLSECIIQF